MSFLSCRWHPVIVDNMRVKELGKVGGCCSPAHLGGFLHCLFPTAGILGSVNIHSIYVYEYVCVQYVDIPGV